MTQTLLKRDSGNFHNCDIPFYKIREYEESNEKSCLVFPKLNGYQVGFPPDAELRRGYSEKLKSVISLIPSVGVVHLIHPTYLMGGSLAIYGPKSSNQCVDGCLN